MTEQPRHYRSVVLDKIKSANKRAHALNLRADLTPEQRDFALEYFNYTCAVCGRQFHDFFSNLTMALDHWIPIASQDCPGTTITNIVPICQGIGGCNNSKRDTDPKQWLYWRYDKRHANKIIARIDAYADNMGIVFPDDD